MGSACPFLKFSHFCRLKFKNLTVDGGTSTVGTWCGRCIDNAAATTATSSKAKVWWNLPDAWSSHWWNWLGGALQQLFTKEATRTACVDLLLCSAVGQGPSPALNKPCLMLETPPLLSKTMASSRLMMTLVSSQVKKKLFMPHNDLSEVMTQGVLLHHTKKGTKVVGASSTTHMLSVLKTSLPSVNDMPMSCHSLQPQR